MVKLKAIQLVHQRLKIFLKLFVLFVYGFVIFYWKEKGGVGFQEDHDIIILS